MLIGKRALPLIPRIRVFRGLDGSSVTSWRWLWLGLDNVKTKKFRLLQLGCRRRLPLYFVCRFKPGEAPLFLYESVWKKILRKPGCIAGKTIKPLDVAQFWRKTYGTGKDARDRFRVRGVALRMGE